MKIELSAQLVNSFGDYEDGWSKTCTSVKEAVEALDECVLSGSPDCEMQSSFKLYWGDTLVFEGAWIFLRQLANIEDEERKGYDLNDNEEFLMKYLYEPNIWLIQEWLDETGDKHVQGLFKGTQREAKEFCKKFDTDTSHYAYYLPDFLN